MHIDQEKFLNLQTLPGRLKAEEAGWYLGFAPHEVPLLVSCGVLKPLGRPKQNAPKYFSLSMLEELRRNDKWLSRATETISQHWRQRKTREPEGLS
jgi:hypothetical protein